MPRLLTVEEAAEELRLDPQTVCRYCREGKLPAVQLGRVWRINAERLEEMLDAKAPAELCSRS